MKHRMVIRIRQAAVAVAVVVWLVGPGMAQAGSDVLNAWHLVRAPSPGPSQAIGGYANGCLAGGVALPLDGTGYQVMRPGRHRYYGHPVLVDYLQALGRRTHGAGLPVFNIGDMAQPRGGPMNTGHASHQVGLDVDIWLRLDLPLLPRDRRDALKEVTMVDMSTLSVMRPPWTQAQVSLVRLAAKDPRVARIFVNPVIKIELCRQAGADRDWLRLIRPWYGHDDHFHVRLNCPVDSPLCDSQKPLPLGDGCDSELASWLPDHQPKAAPKPTPSPRSAPQLPSSCFYVNIAGIPSAEVSP